MAYITIPSKLNSLTLSELEFLYPEKHIPNLPKGIAFDKSQNIYVARKQNGKKIKNIGKSTRPYICVMMIEKFCDENKISYR